MPSPSVLISGAGIAGPTLAYWLTRSGFRPTVVERAPQLRTGGYVIDFWGLGYDIAEKMGLLPELRQIGYDVRELRLVDARGRKVGGFDAGVFRALTEGRFLSLRRGDLAKALYDTIADRCEVVFSDSITSIVQDGDGVQVGFEHGRERRFDFVVGAGGLHSIVRAFAFGDEGTFEKYLGYMVAAFETTGYRPRDENVYVGHAVPGRQVTRFSMQDDRTVFLLVFAADRPLKISAHNRKAQRIALHAQFGNAGWECPQILAALDKCDDFYFDAVSQIRMDRWSKGRVVLLGDAAFCPSLLAGQGSALAMTAAYVLAGELGRPGTTIEGAFARYEDVLRSFMDEKQEAAKRFARSFAPKTALGVFVRNQATKAFAIPGMARLALASSIADKLQLPSYDWLQATP